ncbi:MAG: cation:proton antiporter [Trueperaceae bacterium]|nr:cation:proton antiporter [Trueperaceae bacterium]
MLEYLTSQPALAVASIVALGALAQWAAWRIRLPAILPLLLTGFLVGPVLGWIDPTALIGEELLFPLVSLAVGLILFEGGLTLTIPEVQGIRGVVVRLVSVGALITWFGGALAAYLLIGLPVGLATLFGALIIVTGPTVIGPLLRIVRPKARVANILKWEGVLIDAIGAMVAVLVFEFLLIETREVALGRTVLSFLRFVLVGSAVGVAAGTALAWLLRRRKLPDYLINMVSLAFLFGAFAIASALAPEAGLLASVLMGMVIANLGVPNITYILSFKEDLTVLFISLLFIVLAANVELSQLAEALTLPGLALLATVVLVIRPISVFVSTLGSPLDLREKAYLSWIAPRGIVAAAVSSLFATRLQEAGFAEAGQLVTLVFLVIVGTVLLGSLTARPVAAALGVAEPVPQGFLVLGAHPFARKVAAFLDAQGIDVLLADTNGTNVAAARAEGLRAYHGNVLSDQVDDELPLSGVGRLLALTPSDESNTLAALKYAREFGSNNVFQLAPGDADRNRGAGPPRVRGRLAFGAHTHYRDVARLQAQGALIVIAPVQKGKSEVPAWDPDAEVIPLFRLREDGVEVVAGESAGREADGGSLVVFAPPEAVQGAAPTG